MNLRFFKRHYRSSCLPPLLLFLLTLTSAVQGYGSAHPAPADTIIIGGKYLVVESSLEYDTLRTPHEQQPERPKTPNKKPAIRVGFEAVPGAQFNRLRSTENGFALIDEFVGKNLRTEAAMSANAFAQYQLGTSDLWAYAGAGVEFFTVSGSGANTNGLSDSVFVFRSPETNVLQAIERFRYPIGVEFDTIEVALNRTALAFSAVQVPVQLNYMRSVSRKLELQLFAGVDLRFIRLSTADNWLLVSTVDSRVDEFDAGQADAYRSFAVSPLAGARFCYKLDKQWALLVGARVSHVPSVFTSDNVPFSHNAWRTSLSLGWSYSFDK